MSWYQAKLKTPGNCGQEQVRFHHRERGPDAQARTASKGEVGEPGEALAGVRGPAVRVEMFRLFEETGIAVEDPGAHDNIRSRWKTIAAQLHFFCHGAGQAPGWRIKAHGFLHHFVGVGQVGQILQLRRAAAQDLAQFLAWELSRGGTTQIAVANADGTAFKVLTSSGNNYSPSWSKTLE
jgi:hypothetical protein